MDSTEVPQSSARSRVIVIEDDERLRRYAIEALAGAEELELVGEAGQVECRAVAARKRMNATARTRPGHGLSSGFVKWVEIRSDRPRA